jgi:hypothetical protein
VTDGSSGFTVERDAASDWVRGSLAQGSSLAMLMSQRLGSLLGARLLAPDTARQLVLDDRGRGIRSSDADVIAQRFLARVGPEVVKTLIVEDDLARRGDASVGRDVAFVEDRILRWTSLDDTASAGALLRKGSSGYPLNAFGCRAPATALGLGPGHTLTAVEQARVVDATELIVVSVYDAEAYLMLMTRALEALVA